VYASLYQEQFEGGKIQWPCTDGDILANETIRHRQTQPAQPLLAPVTMAWFRNSPSDLSVRRTSRSARRS
jgi:hypothetical protein